MSKSHVTSTLLDIVTARNSVTQHIQSTKHVLNLIQGNIHDAFNGIKQEQICSILEQNDTTKVAIQKLKKEIIDNSDQLNRLQSKNITSGLMVNKLNSTIAELTHALLLCKYVKHHKYGKLLDELEVSDLSYCIPKHSINLCMSKKHILIDRLETSLHDQENTLSIIKQAYEMETPTPNAPLLDTMSHTDISDYNSPPAYIESTSITHTSMTGESCDIHL